MVDDEFTQTSRFSETPPCEQYELSFAEYFRQIFWSSAIDLPDYLDRLIQEITLDTVELPPGGKAQLSLQLPADFVIILDPVTHTTQFLDVKGEPTHERQSLSLVNHTETRVLPELWIAGGKLEELLRRRKPFLSAKRLLTNQVFRDFYGADTMDVHQRLKITSLTFLFTDLRGSTELYERVGDLAAFDLVSAHFQALRSSG